ncbi:MAG: ABC transporter substrate-binding protein [Candidatus Binatia bacterium]
MRYQRERIRRSAAVLCLFASLLVLFSSTHAQEKIRIGISAVSPGFLPTVVAEKKGFYEKYGLVSEHVISPCAVATTALLSNDLDYAVCAGPGVSGALKGVPLKLVMFTQDRLTYLLLVKPSVQSVADLRGKTIGISSFGSQLHLSSITVLRQHHLEPGKDVNLLPRGNDQSRLAALQSGRIDATFAASPTDIFAARMGYKVLLWTRDYVKLPQNAVVVTEKKLKQAPDQVKGMIKGTIEALQFLRKSKEEAVDVAAEWTKLDHDTTRAVLENYRQAYSVDGAMTDEALEAAIQMELERSKLKKKVPVSLVADSTLLLQAQRELGLSK